MDRRKLMAAGAGLIGSGALSRIAQAQASGQPFDSGQPFQDPAARRMDDPDAGLRAPAAPQPNFPAQSALDTYSRDELVNVVSDFFGVTAEAAAAVIERIFRDNGRPNAYIAGEEGAFAITFGARYGKGLMYMKTQPTQTVYWQGPSVGWDLGGNAARVFTLVYGLSHPDLIYQRFPGVEGSAYLIGGMGVNYQRAEDVTLAPIRAGVGLRLGANIGYLAYTRRRNILPF